MIDIIKLMEEAKLKGRGGAGFPTYQKWQTVLDTKSDIKYIVVNGAEGEPGVKKDHFILDNYLDVVIEGLKIGLETIDNSKAYIYLKKEYLDEFGDKLKKLIKDLPIELFEKKGGYLSGEETTLCNVIEGRSKEPRIKPPYPCTVGINGCPTLVNNVETWYHIAKISKGEYKKSRFYTISGEAKNPGVYEMEENCFIDKILRETDNYPNFDFFVQSGGGMAGEILLDTELGQVARGQGAIVIYNKTCTDGMELIESWVDFFYAENCDKCTPCREGIYRIREMFRSKKFDQQTLNDIFFVLEKTSLCSLGKAIAVPIKSYYKKIGL
jgi:[NiFe] hydrogenase diaphorase moiety large subunit